jgi:hypothetical protein
LKPRNNGILEGKLGNLVARRNRLLRRRSEPDAVHDGQQNFVGIGAIGKRNRPGQAQMKILDLLGAFDLTEAFKTKGDLKRWSAKRTIGGLIAATACNDILLNGTTWPNVALCLVAILPLCLSFMD